MSDETEVADLKRRIAHVESAVHACLSEVGDNLCWLDLKPLADLFGIPFDPVRLPRDRFLGRCERFYDCTLDGKPYEADELTERLAESESEAGAAAMRSAAQELVKAIGGVQDWEGTFVGDALNAINPLLERKA